MFRKKNQPISLHIGSIIFLLIFFLFSPLSLHAATKPSIKIEKGKAITKDRDVTLQLRGPDDITEMRISNNADFSYSQWEKYSEYKFWRLSEGSGEVTVYVKYRRSNGSVTDAVKDTILLEPPEMKIKTEIIEGDTVSSRYVTVSSTVSDGIDRYRISSQNNFTNDDEWIEFSSYIPYVLSRGSGEKSVYIQFRNADGQVKTFLIKVTYNEPANYIEEGSLIKGTGPAVYYYGYDGKLHEFSHALVYHTWYKDFSAVQQVSNAKLAQYSIGDPICVRQGTYLVKFSNSSKVYAVEPGCTLRPIRSAIEATLLYGEDWGTRLMILPEFHRKLYVITSLDVRDEDNDIEDDDRDGLSANVEADYGSSDKNEDTDGDGLSDYEEIVYWFSDPNDKDSDGDGFDDGQEVLSGYSPVGPSSFSSLPNDTYRHPAGTLLRLPGENTKYYVTSHDTMKKIGLTTNDSFITNRFQVDFITVPFFKMDAQKSSGSVSKSDDTVRQPIYRSKENGKLYFY